MKLSDYSPILFEDDNFAQSTNGDQILAYRVVLPESYSLSDKQFDEIHAVWMQTLKKLPKSILLKQDFFSAKEFEGGGMPAMPSGNLTGHISVTCFSSMLETGI